VRRRLYAWKTHTWTNHHSVLLSSRVAQLSHAFLDEYGATSVEEHPRPYIVDEAWNSRYYARQEVSIPENLRSMTRPRRLRAKVHSTNSRFCRGKVPVACYLRRATRAWVAQRLEVSEDKSRRLVWRPPDTVPRRTFCCREKWTSRGDAKT
jgi:hypothetical protein